MKIPQKKLGRFLHTTNLAAITNFSFLITLSIGVANNAFAQSLGGGTGGAGVASGGASTVTASGNSGGTGCSLCGGGGGGGGISGGAGGAGGTGAAGGAGGIPSSINGGAGSPSNPQGAGGGGGGAAGVVISSATTNSGSISGGSGGVGGGSTTAGGGGGGAGGYGAIVNSSTYTNGGAVQGGSGGAGGSSDVGFYNANGGSGGVGVYLSGTSNLVNSGTVSGGVGGSAGVGGSGGSTGTSAPGVYVAAGSISTVTNNGAITGGTGSYGIQNAGTISTLNNAQAGLTYTGILPTNYNIIVNSASSFGTFSATSFSGSTTFGITSSTLAAGTYASVISGLSVGNFAGGLTGSSGSYNYSLGLQSGSLTIWDLIVSAINNSGGSSSGSGGGGDSGGSSTTSTPRYGNLTISSGTITSSNNNAVVNGTTVTIPSGTIVTGAAAVTNTGTTPGITNNGFISGTSYGIYNAPDATIVNLTNNGIISGGTAGIANLSPNTIQLLVNTGVILGGIDNTQGRIITLQNAQGGTVPLALSGNLPNNYQVIVNGLSSYGQLAVTKAAGQMTFGIATGSVVYTGLTYTSVLTGVGANNLLNTAGSSGGYLFKLTPENSGTVWNMTIGASVTDTQSSLQSTTSSLQTQYALQSNGVIAGLTYDCSLFGENGICISAGGRQTGSSSFINGTTSALLIGAYRVNEKIRVGAYLDQNLSASNPNGIISNSNSTPMGGLFAVWNEQDDGLGTEVKASLGYNNKGMTIARPVVGTSEPGSGSTALTSQGANVVAKYNFGIDSRTTVSPYVGARYLSTVMNGYSEGQASNVLVPLAYSSLSMNATTALAGVGANHRLEEEITLSASAGMEADVQTTNGSYTVTNVNGLTPVALNPNPNKVRPTATAAAYYKLHKDAQIGLSVLYRQDSMTGMSSTTGMVTYTMGM